MMRSSAKMRWLAWLCLSMMFWTAAVESTHNHPNQTADDSCSICATAHSARATVVSAHPQPVFCTVGLLREEPALAKSSVDVFRLGIRGPPSVL
jgi:hypothetical protein